MITKRKKIVCKCSIQPLRPKNIDKKIDYFAFRSMVIQSLENIAREEVNRRIARINLNKTFLDIQQEDKEDIVIANSNVCD